MCFAVIARHKFGFKGVLYIFSGCCFLGLLFSFWVPETKGLTLEELSGDSDKDGVVDENEEPAAFAESKTPTSQV
ncbi:phosphate transporter [Aphanomyces cochlioides]|nr:phosphate transporter [Aphanomyces cochlioides]